MYEGFAEVYDELMSNVDYPQWADFYRQMMVAYGVREGRICECACGTGSLTMELAKLGYTVTGVDLSQDMLWIAAQKAREQGMAIPFVRQDMRALRLHRPMDAILATCDGVNYLMEEEDVLSFFRSAYAALRPGGGLFFDISTPYKLENALGNQIICDDTPHITYLWQNRYSAKHETVEMHLCIFVRQEDGSYRRIDEEQKQKAHRKDTLIQLLRQAGFEQVQVYGSNQMSSPKESEHRWHFAAIRRMDPNGNETGGTL